MGGCWSWAGFLSCVLKKNVKQHKDENPHADEPVEGEEGKVDAAEVIDFDERLLISKETGGESDA